MNFDTKKLVDLTINFNSKRIPVSGKVRSEMKAKSYPYYGAQGIIDYVDEYIFDGEYLLIAEDGENLKSRKNDIALIASGKFWVNNHAHILQINELANIYFIKEYLNRMDLSGYITGSVQPKLNKQNLNQIRLNVPSREIQDKIGHIIGIFERKISNNLSIISILDQLAQTIFKRWFIDFEFPSENGEPYKSSGGEMVDSELGPIPKGWKVWGLDEFVNSISHSINKKEKKQAIFLNTSDILEGQFLHSNYSSTSELPGQAKKLIQKNDILYSEIRPANKRFAYVDFDAQDYVVSTKLMVLRTNELIFSSKCFYLFLKSKSTLETLQRVAESRSGTFPQITFKELSTFKFALPEKNNFEKNYKLIDNLVDLQHGLIKKNQSLKAIRNTVLPKLMSGEIGIPFESEEEVHVQI